MLEALRRMLGAPLRITREQALSIAKQHAEERGLAWVEPVSIVLGWRRYEIMTNADHKGGNVTVWVDGSTGEVVRSAWAFR